MSNGYLLGDKNQSTAATTVVITVGTSGGGGTAHAGLIGDAYFVWYANVAPVAATSIVDSKGNTWTNILTTSAGIGFEQQLWACLTPTAALTTGSTITITQHSSMQAVAAAFGVTGGAGQTVDLHKILASGSTASTTGSTGTLASSGETVFGIGVINGSTGYTTGSTPNTPVVRAPQAGIASYVLWTLDVASSSAITFTETAGTAGAWDLLGISLITSSSVTVPGVVSNVTSASPVGSVGIKVVGVVSNVTSASPAGAVTGSANVIGVVSNTTSASPAGSVGIKVSGVVSNTTSASPVGTVGIKTTGAVSNVTSASPAGSVSGSANVTGHVSNVTSASPAGAVGVTVLGHVSNVTSASPAGSVGIKISGVVSNVTSASPAGAVTGSANVTGVVSRVTSASPAGSVSGSANVIGVVSNTTSASPPGSNVSNVTVIGVVSNVVSGSPAAQWPRTIYDFTGSTGADSDPYDGLAVLTSPVYKGSGTLVSPFYKGTAENDFYDGTASVFEFDGTADVEPVYNGIATMATVLNGTTKGFIMQEQDVTLGEFNDELVNVAIKDNGGSAVNLTGKTLTAYLKTAAGVDDDDPSVIVLTSASGITWVSQSGGTAQVAISHTDISNLAIGFWRVDVVDGSGNQNTAIFGTVTITPL